jgi:hypothetical protein
MHATFAGRSDSHSASLFLTYTLIHEDWDNVLSHLPLPESQALHLVCLNHTHYVRTILTAVCGSNRSFTTALFRSYFPPFLRILFPFPISA